MIGARVAIPKMLHSVMDNANGLSPDSDLFNLMFLRVDITSYVIAKCQRMLLSATRPIKLWSNGTISITEDSSTSGEWEYTGLVSHTGCSLSINENFNHLSLLLIFIIRFISFTTSNSALAPLISLIQVVVFMISSGVFL